VTIVGGRRYFIQINAPIPDPQYSGQGHTLPGFLVASGPADPFDYRPYASIAYHLQGFTVAVVPEPGTWALLGTGLLAIGGVARVRRRTS
jgi:hypothetical protein